MTGVPSPSAVPRLHRGALAVAGAVLSTALVWAAAHALGVELRVDPRNGRPPGVVNLPFAVMVTFAVSALGWGVRALLQRVTSRASTVWTVLAFGTLAASFLPVFMVGATGATRAALAAMHLAAAAVLIPVFGHRTP
ncbi:hypothetical protein HS048_28920 [Planomonospora sp. ID91781]|uniref:Uncharacterized protein n=1 Tax=Planomonospora sphaerica TaxID=161355 RepID=A0A171DGL4_9ACTN|nr:MULTISPECIES: DUF6069 family protein [Planomonospora]MBG0824732.1 hypothetical protein [Planomonospora sp. ID91781]GAT68371.1 hypothetical protein PS9374_04033 [Planomonospora sphaerica]